MLDVDKLLQTVERKHQALLADRVTQPRVS